MLIDLEQIKEILKNIDDSINIDELKIENDIFADNFLDSLQAVELFMILEEKFNTINVNLPGVEFYTEASCIPNPEYCTDDGCPDFMTPTEEIEIN